MFIKLRNAIINLDEVARFEVSYTHEGAKTVFAMLWLVCKDGKEYAVADYDETGIHMPQVLINRIYDNIADNRNCDIEMLADAPVTKSEASHLKGVFLESALDELEANTTAKLSIGERYNKEHSNASSNSSH